MIKIATVFSGIGAVEQALKRLKIDHMIEFACDNGNISIDINYEKEFEHIRKLKSVKEKREYVRELYNKNSRRTNFVENSYKANYEIVDDNFFYDIKLLDGTDFESKIDLFVGGSPCQSFSAIGTRGGFEDARGTLFYEFVRLINEIKPKVFLYENVHGVLTHDKGNTWKVMENIFHELGYNWGSAILDSRNYGIPQGRRRIFVVGFREKVDFDKFSFPEPKDLKLEMKDLLLDMVAEGLLKDENGELCAIKNNGEEVPENYYLSEKLLKYCLSPGTKNFMHHNSKIDLPIARALLSTMGNSHRSSVNNYVTTNNRVRALHQRETHRLMGFPDSYKIVVSKAQAYKQSGNSIVVDVLMALIKSIFPKEINNGKNE